MPNDSDRINWLEAQMALAIDRCQSGSGRGYIDYPIRVSRDGDIYLWGWDPQKSIREAIDAAMSQTAPESGSSMLDKTGVELIAVERQRQISKEKWTPAHDDEHDEGELARAAACYAALPLYGHPESCSVPAAWPWERLWWKPKNDPIANLARAGALIVAEIDRIQRLRATPDTAQEQGTLDRHGGTQVIACPNCGEDITPVHRQHDHYEPHGEYIWQEWDECPVCKEILDDGAAKEPEGRSE